jgi:hypothetical protein
MPPRYASQFFIFAIFFMRVADATPAAAAAFARCATLLRRANSLLPSVSRHAPLAPPIYCCT